ncbi:MAG: co-chaperone GroES [Candidatus Omnitrophica bacterium]|nr:co-chaperone GroES [Candidatus Omnitrophota bacterium]
MEKEIILVGDKVLIEPGQGDSVTDYGLYLPQTVKDKEKVQSGKIVRSGPGYPIFDPSSFEDEPWAVSRQRTKYFPLQVKTGDFCLFLRDSGVEVEFEKKKYYVIPHSAILLLIRSKIPSEIPSL